MSKKSKELEAMQDFLDDVRAEMNRTETKLGKAERTFNNIVGSGEYCLADVLEARTEEIFYLNKLSFVYKYIGVWVDDVEKMFDAGNVDGFVSVVNQVNSHVLRDLFTNVCASRSTSLVSQAKINAETKAYRDAAETFGAIVESFNDAIRRIEIDG